MATVIHELPDGRDFIEVSTVADWLESHGWPAGWQVFSGDRRLGPDDAALLTHPESVLRVVSVPGEPATIAYAVIAVVAAAYSIYLANSLEVPQIATNRNASTANNELAGRSNKPAKIGQRVPDIWGLEPLAYPLLLSSWRYFVGGIENEISYLLLGAGEYHIFDIRDGDTLLSNVSGSGLNVYPPGKSPYMTATVDHTPSIVIGDGVARALAPQVLRQSNEIDGITLAAPNAQETGTTLLITSDGWLEVTDAATGQELADLFDVGDEISLIDCYGWELIDDGVSGAPNPGFPIRYYLRHSLADTYTITTKDATRIKVTPGSQPGWAHIPGGGQYQALAANVGHPFNTLGAIDTSVTGYAPEFPAGSYTTGVLAQITSRDDYAPAGASNGSTVVGPISIPPCTGLALNVVARNGIYKLSSGEPNVESVTVEATIDHPDGQDVITFDIGTNPLNRRDATGRTLEHNWTTKGPATVTLRRTSNTDKSFSGTVVDEIQWRDLYAVNQLPEDYNAGSVTTMLLRVESNADAARVKERKLNCRVVRKLSSDANADARFTSVLPALHSDQFNGRRNPATIDTDTLGLLSAEISAASAAIDYPVEGRVCGYTFDDTNLSYEDELHLLCKAVNLRPYHIGGDISLVWEYKRDVDCLLTYRDITPGTFKLQRNFTPSREFTGVELSYKNRVRGEQLTVTAGSQDAPEAIELKGQHYEEMASYAANSQYARQRYQRISAECEVGQIIRRLAVGMRLQVEDCTRYKSVGGEVVSISGLDVTVSQPVPVGVTAIWLSRRNGDAYRVDCTRLSEYVVQLAGGTVLPEPLYTDWQERRTRYLMWGPTIATKPLDLLVTEIDIKGGSSGVVRLVNYDERYYQWPLS